MVRLALLRAGAAMFTGGEVIALFGVLFGPICGGFGALFLAYRKSQAELLKQKDAEISRIVADKDSQITTLRTDLGEAYRQLFRSVGVSARSAQATAIAVETTRQVVQPLLNPENGDHTPQGA